MTAPARARVELRRSAEDVFGYLVDLRRHPDWQPDLLQVRLVTPPPVAVGSRAVQVRRMSGTVSTYEVEVVELVEDRRLELRAVSPGAVEPTWSFALTPVPTGTRVDYEVDLRPNGPARLLAPLSRRLLARTVRTHLRLLAARLDPLS